MKRILLIVGSLRKDSFNRQLANEAARLLEGRAEVSFLSYEDIPFMNQDLEDPVPAPVARIREEVLAADALWFFSPEYNHSYTGVLKNLLDWLSRPLVPGNYASGTAIKGKTVAIAGAAGNSAAGYSRTRLRELLVQIKTQPLEDETGVALNPEAFKTGILTVSAQDREQLKKQADHLLQSISV